MTLNLNDQKGLEAFRRLVEKADVVGREFPPGRQGPARHRLRQPAPDQPAHRLWQYLRIWPGWPQPQAARLRSFRAGHGRPDVDYMRVGIPAADLTETSLLRARAR